MELKDYAALAGIASIMISGSCLVLTWIGRAFWGLTWKRKVQDDETRFIKMETDNKDRFAKVQSDINQVDKDLDIAEEKNKEIRHNFHPALKALESLIDNKIEISKLEFKLFLEEKLQSQTAKKK